MRGILRRAFILLSMGCQPLFAADLRPNTEYVIAFNRALPDLESSEQCVVIRESLEEVKTFARKVPTTMLDPAVREQVFAEIDGRNLASRDSYIRFRTDASGRAGKIQVFGDNLFRFFGNNGQESPATPSSPPAPSTPPTASRPPVSSPSPSNRIELKDEVLAALLALKPESRRLVVVGRRATSEEKRLVPNVLETSHQRFYEHKESDLERQRIVDKVKSDFPTLFENSTPFSFYWGELQNRATRPVIACGVMNHLLVGEEFVSIPEHPLFAGAKRTSASPPAKDGPSSRPQSGIERPGNLAQAIYLLLEKGLDSPMNLEGSVFEFGDETLQNQLPKYRANELGILLSFSHAADFPQVIEALSPQAFSKMLAIARNDDHLFHPVANNYRGHLNDHPRVVAKQILSILETITEHLDYLDYDNDLHSHSWTVGDSILSDLSEALVDCHFLGSWSQFRSFLSREQITYLLRDTNTDSDESRKEPIDILAYKIAEEISDEFAGFEGFEKEKINQLVGESIKKQLNASYTQSYLPAFVGGSSVDSAEDFVLFCPGGAWALLQQNNQTLQGSDGYIRNNSLYGTLVLKRHFVETFGQSEGSLGLRCGTENGTLSIHSGKLKKPLTDPSSAHFEIGNDHKIKAVSTFSLTGRVTENFFNMLQAGTALSGYSVVEKRNVSELKQEFLNEISDTDFYFPVNHTSYDSHPIGNVGGMLFRVQKKVEQNTTEIVFFTPPTSDGQGVSLDHAEVARIFKARRSRPESRRLFITNLKCNSIACPPFWMNAYQASIPLTLRESEYNRIANEVPVAIGAAKSFDDYDNIDGLLKNAEVPLGILEKAQAESSVADFIHFLTAMSFQPVSNLGKPMYFDVRASHSNLRLKLVTSTGEHIF